MAEGQRFHEFYARLGVRFPEPNLNDIPLEVLSSVVMFMSEFKEPHYVGNEHFIVACKSQKHFNYMVMLPNYSVQECNVLENKSKYVEELLTMLPHDEKTSECAICLDDMKNAEEKDGIEDGWDLYYRTNFECIICTFHAHKSCIRGIVVNGEFNCPQCRTEYPDPNDDEEEEEI
jgi:hypothetical protein